MEATTRKEFKNYLEKRKVKVKPVESSGKWSNLLIKGEERRKDPFLLNKAKRSFQIPYNRKGELVKVLDDYESHYTAQFPDQKLTEQQFFEKVLGFDLSRFVQGKKNFWRFNEKGRVTIGKQGLDLNLSEALDMLKYKILLAQDSIAKTYESRLSGNYEFVMVDQNKLISKRLEVSKSKADAYAKLTELLANERRMIDFIKATGKNVPIKVTNDWLKDQLVTSLENDYAGFLNIANDELFEDRVFIYDAVKAGGIIKVSKARYALDNGKELGDIRDTIHFFRDPEHQELKLRIQSQIDRINDK